MTKEKSFFEELARAPELPPLLYGKVRRTIRRRTVFTRTVWSLAATLLLTVGVTAMLLSGRGTAGVISPEVISELQSVKDFGSGKDISRDLETYALYEGDSFN